jgi:hypothetical protein
MLLLVAILNGLTISFAAEARFGNPLAPPASAEGKAPPVTGAAPDAVVPVEKSLPRYYFHAYVTVDEKGDARSFTDQVQIDDYLQKLQKWIPDRILKSDPGNCEQANPCEELNLREETSGNEVILVTEILQKPVVNSASIIPHNPLRTQTVKKSTWLETRSCLSNVASYSLMNHDKLHRKSN